MDLSGLIILALFGGIPATVAISKNEYLLAAIWFACALVATLLLSQ